MVLGLFSYANVPDVPRIVSINSHLQDILLNKIQNIHIHPSEIEPFNLNFT